MTRQDKQEIINEIDHKLATTQRLWEGKSKSHAYIIGYLEGALKQVKRDIENSERLNK